mgnify:CR=1 FL=1
MTYIILLAQKIAIENNLGLDLLELTVITELKKLTSNTAWQNAAVKHTDGNLYFLFRLSYIIELLPLVFINNNGIDAKTKALRRILVELEKKGFLIRADFNREKGGNYCHITSKSDILISDTITKNGNAPLPEVSTTITKNGNAPLPETVMYTSTNISELNKENNNNNGSPNFFKPNQEQGEQVKDEKEFFSGFEEELHPPPVELGKTKPTKPVEPVKTTNVLRLDQIWGTQYAGQTVWLQKAGEEVAVWLQNGAEDICKPNSFDGMDLAEMFVFWVGKEQGRIFQSKSPVQWKTSICNYARVQKANGGFKAATKSIPYPNAELDEAPKGFIPATEKLKGAAYFNYTKKVREAKAAGLITHEEAVKYINFHSED